MALQNWAYIYLSPGFNSDIHQMTAESAQCRFTAVGLGFDEKEKVIEVARSLVKEGAQLIELCGGFGPTWVAKVSEAVGSTVPVGTTLYGPEARKPLVDILTS